MDFLTDILFFVIAFGVIIVIIFYVLPLVASLLRGIWKTLRGFLKIPLLLFIAAAIIMALLLA